MSQEKEKVEAVRTAFQQEFERFEQLNLDGIDLASAEELIRTLGELKVRHTGKKSAIAGTMKLVGSVAPEERAAFGQLVQAVERDITSAIETAEAKLKSFIINEQIERERLDVT